MERWNRHVCVGRRRVPSENSLCSASSNTCGFPSQGGFQCVADCSSRQRVRIQGHPERLDKEVPGLLLYWRQKRLAAMVVYWLLFADCHWILIRAYSHLFTITLGFHHSTIFRMVFIFLSVFQNPKEFDAVSKTQSKVDATKVSLTSQQSDSEVCSLSTDHALIHLSWLLFRRLCSAT